MRFQYYSRIYSLIALADLAWSNSKGSADSHLNVNENCGAGFSACGNAKQHLRAGSASS